MTEPAGLAGASVPLAPVWGDRNWLACALWLWLGCSAVYLLTAPGRIDIIDGAVRFQVADALIELHKPIVRDPWLPALPGRGGDRYAVYPPGHSLFSVPFVFLGHLFGGGSLESRQFAFSLATMPFAAGAVALVFLIYGRLGLEVRRALGWSLVVAFGSLLWPYAGSTFDVAIQAFWITLGVWAGIEALSADSGRWALVSGVAFCSLGMVQELYLALSGAIVLAAAPRPSMASVRRALGLRATLIVLAFVALAVALLLAYNAVRFERLVDPRRLAAPYPVRGNPLLGLSGLFVSPAKSVFLYSPTYALALVGLFRLLRRAPGAAWAILGTLGLQLAIISNLTFWAGEWAWGPRYLVATLPLVSVGLPFAIAPGRKRVLKLGVVGAGIVVQLLAISVDHQRYYFERGYAPFFWTDPSAMYRGSPLLARPGELVDILRRRDLERVRALVPGPRPLSMTSSIFGPPLAVLRDHPGQWLRQYLVFLVPRPWPAWSRLLPPDLRPASPWGLGIAAALVGALAWCGLAVRVRAWPASDREGPDGLQRAG